MKNIIIIFLIFFIFLSCKEEKIFYNVRTYQYHEKDITDFSFLSKYKELRVLDLSNTNIKSLSFLKDLTELRVLILNNTNIKSIREIKYLKKLEKLYLDTKKIKDKTPLIEFNKRIKKMGMFNCSTIIDEDCGEEELTNIFSFKDKDITFLDFIPLNLWTLSPKKIYFFEDISGIIQLNKLKILKLALKNDLYIDYLTKLPCLEELHLSGDIKHLPIFNTLKKLYLYNVNITDFSFLKKSNIDYLYIVTKDFNNNYWNKLKEQFPNIKIQIKNRLFTPIKNCIHLPYKHLKHFRFYNLYLTGDCNLIKELRKGILTKYLSIDDYITLVEEINIDIDYLWKDNITLLEKAIKDNNKDAIEYLKSIKKNNKYNNKNSCLDGKLNALCPLNSID